MYATFSSCGTQAWLPHGLWDVPGPGIEVVFPALQGKLLIIGPPGKTYWKFLSWIDVECVKCFCASVEMIIWFLCETKGELSWGVNRKLLEITISSGCVCFGNSRLWVLRETGWDGGVCSMTTCRSSLLEMQAWSSSRKVDLDIHTQYECDHRCVL